MITAMSVAHPEEILCHVADRMASAGTGALPVVDRVDPGRLDGLITEFDLMQGRQRLLEEERHAERVPVPRRFTARPGRSRLPGR